MDYEKKYKEAFERARNVWRFSSNNAEIMRMEELFPELRESEDERIRKAILELVRQSSEVLGKQNQNNMITWLEKQGEQKATDEVKPKFNVGDWIIGYYTSYQVLSINNEGYVVEDIDGNKINILFENEKFHHLWTIKDAKDGDVVVVPSIEGSEHSEQIFIFKEIKNRDYVKNVVEYYCRVCDNEFYVNERGFMGYADDYFVPSTQEQQKLLFQKMKEAGYEWNSEKKELKKISQRIVSAEVKEALYDKPTDEEMKELLRTEYEKGRADTLSEMKSSWSEEDEVRLQACLDTLQAKSLMGKIDTVMTEWLKSLKDRYTWKPSNEQIEALEHFVRSIGESGYASPYDNNTKLLYSLLEQLKKLKA